MHPEAVASWRARMKEQLTDKAAQIDPDNEQDWESMGLGWALAQGMTINEAREFVTSAHFAGLL
jgi:hypothetical protein